MNPTKAEIEMTSKLILQNRELKKLEQENAQLRSELAEAKGMATYKLFKSSQADKEKLKAEVEELKKVKKIFNEYMTTNITHVEINKLRELVKELSDELNLENSTIENHKKIYAKIKEVLGV